MSVRAILFTLAIGLAACTQAPTVPEAPAASAEDQTAALVEALTPTVSELIGQPISLETHRISVMGDWAWLVATPRQPDGAPLDWAATSFASAHENGVLGSDGATYALFKREGETWRVVDYVVGPTDVAWVDWPARHGAPEALFEMPEDPPAP